MRTVHVPVPCLFAKMDVWSSIFWSYKSSETIISKTSPGTPNVDSFGLERWNSWRPKFLGFFESSSPCYEQESLALTSEKWQEAWLEVLCKFWSDVVYINKLSLDFRWRFGRCTENWPMCFMTFLCLFLIMDSLQSYNAWPCDERSKWFLLQKYFDTSSKQINLQALTPFTEALGQAKRLWNQCHRWNLINVDKPDGIELQYL